MGGSDIEPQEITKIIKAALIVAGLSGVKISPEHQALIIEGGLALYGVLSTIEAWAKRRARICRQDDKVE